MESRQGREIDPRARGLFSVVALVAVAFGAVALGMTVLGDAVADTTPAPSPTPTPTQVLATYSPVPTDYVAPPPTVKLPSTPPDVVTKYTATKDDRGIWSVVWRYPAIRAGTTPLADQINADILSEVQTRIAIFQAGPAAVRQVPGKVNTLTGVYSVNLAAPDLLSLTLRWEEDTAPSHVTPNVLMLNYSLAAGRQITFDELFSDQTTALSVISIEARRQLASSLGADYDPLTADRGTGPVATNFINWALTSAGLKITFDVYRVGTFADGTPSVSIPWTLLERVMNPNSPAGRLAGLTPLPTAVPPPGWTPTPLPSPEPTETPWEVPTEMPLPDTPPPS